ncbi:hypothetical protein ACFL20_13440, partial [Spirochaetota bacterium]
MSKKKTHKKSIEKSKKKVLKSIEKHEDKKDGKPSKSKIKPKKTKEKAAIRKTTKKDKPKKQLKKKSNSLSKRISIQLAKTLFLRIPALIIILVIISLIFLKFYLTPQKVETLITTNFNEMSNGKISLKVKEFSPYSGFTMENILIKNGPEFNNSTFVEIEKLVFKYGLFPIFIGNIRFPEIGIYKPRIYLTEKDGHWNAARLMKPGKPGKDKIKKEKKEEDKEEGDEISLPISIEFLLKFILDDLRVYAKGSKLNASMEGLTFNFHVIVYLIYIICKGKPALKLTWKLIFENDKGTPKFNSHFKFGTYKTPVRLKNIYLAPLDFLVSYDMNYNPAKDYLKLNHLGIQFRGNKWIYLSGEVNEVTKAQNLNLKMEKSIIPLKDLYPYYLKLTK